MTPNGKKHLFIWALLVLAAFCVYFYCAITSANENTFQEKWYEKKLEIDMVCDEVDYLTHKNGDWDIDDYQDMVSAFILRLHEQKGTQASVFDSDLNLISRIEDHPIRIMEYPELMASVAANESGELMINSSSPYRLYYRWILVDTEVPERLLLVVSMSENAVMNPAGACITWGAAALILTVFIYVIFTLVMLTSTNTKTDKKG